MKAFKGCTNPDCKAYKKIHFKKDDQFCLKCGEPLSFVCAECWKVMDSNKEKYCISCAAQKEQKQQQRINKVKNGGGVVLAGVGAVAVGVKQLSKNMDVIVEGGKKIVKVAADATKLIKK